MIVIILALLTAAGCAPRQDRDAREDLDRAILLFVEEDYSAALERFQSLLGRLQSDDDLETAYLYMARCCETLGDYQGAADALTAGMVIRGDPLFQEHIAALRSKIEADPEYLGKQPALSRAHLACLIDELFLSRPVAGVPAGQPSELDGSFYLPPDLKRHWAADRIRRVLLTGAMLMLPDSMFHPDVKVTRAAFYFAALSLARYLDAASNLSITSYGLNAEPLLRRQLAAMDDPAINVYISGREAVGELRRLEQLLRSRHD